MRFKNLNLSKNIEAAIGDNLYYFCDLGLDKADSWACVDKSSVGIQKKSEVFHLSSQYQIWFTGVDNIINTPEISLYEEARYQNSSRFNTFLLDDRLKLMLKRKVRHYKLDGMILDNRVDGARKFKNVECYDVKNLTQF